MRPAINLRSPESRAETRRRWIALIALAGAADAGWPESRRAELRHDIARIAALSFPPEGLSAKRAAMGFLELAGAFAGCDLVDRREALEPAVRAAAKALDFMLHEDARALATRTWMKGDLA